MKVLLATIFAYPQKGGVGVYIHELKKGLEQNGHQVDIVAREHDEYFITRPSGKHSLLKRKSGRKGAPLLRLSGGAGGGMQKYLYKIREEAGKFLQAIRSVDLRQYQIIHVQDIVSASVLSQNKPSLTPLVMTVHGCVTAEYYYYGYIKPRSLGWEVLSSFESGVIHQCQQTIVPSNWLLGVYKKCQIGTGNMRVISNGIDVTGFRKKMNRKTGLKNPDDKTIILSTGRLEKVKGLHVLLDALVRLKRSRKDWICWIVGSGTQRRQLMKQSRRLGLGRYVKFLGRRNDIPALLKQADIYVIPSLQENYPFSLVEAQVAGKPIIASRIGGITEMVKHDKNGLLFPAGNGKRLCQHLKSLLKNPGMQTRLGKGARAMGRTRLSLDMMMKQVLEVYSDAKSSARKDRE